MAKRLTEQDEVTGRVVTGRAPRKAKEVPFGTRVDTSTAAKRAKRWLVG
jgi:hypothetical protein